MTLQLAMLFRGDESAAEWVEAALLYAQATAGCISAERLTEGVRGLPQRRAEGIVRELAGAGVLTPAPASPRNRRGYLYDRYTLTSADSLRLELRAAAAAARIMDEAEAARPEENNFRLLATVPEALNLPGESGIHPLASELQRLVISASRSVVVLNPFFTEDGFMPLGDALLARAEQGVDIRIFVRDIDSPHQPNFPALKRFAERVRQSGAGQRIEVIQFQHRPHGAPTVTYHAKVVLVDGRRAYLGSANLTGYGMERTLELGAILTGPAVADLAHMLERVAVSPLCRRLPLSYFDDGRSPASG